MDFKEIDHLFDAAMERLDSKAPLLKGAYETYPLGQDHFLLQKSWKYFKDRIHSIENAYEEQLTAKRDEIAALQKQLSLLKESAGEFENQNTFLNAFQETFVKSRSLDYIDFKNAQARLNESWEEERLKLESKISGLEQQILKEKNQEEVLLNNHREREKSLQTIIDDLRNKLALKGQEEMDKIKDLMVHQLEKEEIIQSREGKIDLLKGELNRANEINKKLKSEILLWERRGDSLIAKTGQIQSEVDAHEQKIDQLNFKIEALQREKEEIRRNWQKEEASWRELWEKAREIQEKEKSRRKI